MHEVNYNLHKTQFFSYICFHSGTLFTDRPTELHGKEKQIIRA